MTEDQRPLASVIVLGYNDKKYLETCLGSLLDQDMPPEDYELIYADNASTDGSVDFVSERFPRVRIIRFDKNYGFAEGNNRAAAVARGRYISFQNDDTIAHRRWLPELIKAVQSDPLARASHAAGLPLHLGKDHERVAPLRVGVMCEITRYGYIDFTETPLNGPCKPTLFVAGGSFLIDSEILGQLQYYFDPTFFMYNEDTDLGLRINNLGYRIIFTPRAAMYHERAPSRRTILNRRGLRMTYLATRNRFIAFYKNMYTLEFLLALPLLCFGTIIKLRTLPMSPLKKMLYAAGLAPYTLFALLMAALHFPRYAGQRRHILSLRPQGSFWLLKELWKRPIPPPTPLTFGILPT
jgi:GT2 family glycosyltransferase